MTFNSWMGYFQDDWKITPTFTLSLGLRYELTEPSVENDDKMNRVEFDAGSDFDRVIRAGELGSSLEDRSLISFDKNNFAPRIGFAWQPGDKWTVRSSTGVFYGGSQGLGASARMLRNFPFVAAVQARGNSRSPIFLLKDTFPSDFLGDLNAPVMSVGDLPNNSVMRTWSKEFALPQVYQWNFGAQRQLMENLALTTAYVGSGTNNLMYAYNINAPVPDDPDEERQRRRFFSSLKASPIVRPELTLRTTVSKRH